MNWTDPHGKTLTFHNSGLKVTDEDWNKIFRKGLDKKAPKSYSKKNGKPQKRRRA